MFIHKLSTILIIISSVVFISGCKLFDTFKSDLTGNYDDDKKHIDRIEVEYLIDNATSVITYYNPPPNTPAQETLVGAIISGEITSIAGWSEFYEDKNSFETDFNNRLNSLKKSWWDNKINRYIL